MVPFCKPDIRPEDAKAVADCIASGWLTTGPNCTKFEEQLAARIGAANVLVTSSLTSAVAPLISALFEPTARRRKAVFPTWTFSSVPMEFMHMGFDVELVDVEPDTLMLPVREYPGADVIVPTHLFGNQVNLKKLHELNPKASIIDDAAHLSPVKRDLSPVAASLYSFYATKPLSTGEGGAVAINCTEAAKRFKQARLHGISKDAFGRYRDPSLSSQQYDIARPGWKANMMDSCAALGLSVMPRLNAMRARRREIVETYKIAFDPLGIETIRHQPGSSYHLAAIRLPHSVKRLALMQALGDMGIVTSVHFTPLHRMTFWAETLFGFSPDEYRDLGAARGKFPVAEDSANRVLSLPLSSAMTDKEVTDVIRAVWDAYPVGVYGKVEKAAVA
jgi:dTDP-4-amino-4,6-dideoxygalactose transaminase